MFKHGLVTCLFACSAITSLITPTYSIAESTPKLAVRMGESISPMNIGPIGSSEISYIQPLENIIPISNINLFFEAQAGQLTTQVGDGFMAGIGPRLEVHFSPTTYFATGGRLVYLDKYKYQLRHDRTKHYGGPRQFQSYIELSFAFNNSLSIGYRLQHMSNGRAFLPDDIKYDVNPSLNTHNIVIQIPFD